MLEGENNLMFKTNCIITGLFFIVVCLVAPKDLNGFQWKNSLPEQQGMSTGELERAWRLLKNRRTNGLLIIRNDSIVFERYSKGYDKSRKQYTASLTKSIVGGMALLVALNERKILLDDPAYKYIPPWRYDPLKSKISIRHLATHSSGIGHGDNYHEDSNDPNQWGERFWNLEDDLFEVVRDHARLKFKPGSSYLYSGPGYAMLGYAVTASIINRSPADIYNLLRESVMIPIGVEDNEWSIGYGKTFVTDGLQLYAIWSGASFTPRAAARVGRLMLNKGNWEGQDIVGPQWVEKMVTYAGTPLPDRSDGEPWPAPGICWWTNFDLIWPSVPADAFVGAGAGGQVLWVVPSLNLIVVRNGKSLGNFWERVRVRLEEKMFKKKPWDYRFWGQVEKYIFTPIMKAIENKIPQ